jgi:dTDP-4-dehydrorhamnose 3,5-epimerase
MKLIDRPLRAAALFEQTRHLDERGAFARIFCRASLAEHGIATNISQANLSHSCRARTLRGLHMQLGASAETKVVQCLQGRLFDVIVDLRPESPSFLRWRGFELSAENGRVLVVPEGFAHGILTLTADVLLAYLVTAPYDAEAERGFRFDDPAFGIAWPHPPEVISAKDRRHPPFAMDRLTAGLRGAA